MESTNNLSAHSYALRIEGKPWLDDLSLDQAWAVLRSEYQAMRDDQELLFMLLLPSGEMPAKCLPRSLFGMCIGSPAMLQATMRSAAQARRAPLTLAYSACDQERR